MLTDPEKSNQNTDLIERMNDAATLTLSPEDRRAQRISNLLSIADNPSSESARRNAEKIIDEMS